MRFSSKVLESIQAFWKDIPKNRRYGIIIAAAVILSLSITAAILLNAKNYKVLYTGLSAEEAGEVYQRLSDMDVDTKIQGTGTIMVPENQVDQVRMQLAADGYPKSGFTYDLYMNNTGLGVTEFDKNNYLRFQLEERLQKTIETMEGVNQAVVTLSLPEADAYVLESESQSATASVLLSLNPGVTLSPRQVAGIESLVVKSVSGLTPENVSIVDQYMNVLNDHPESQEDLSFTDSRLEYENQIRTRLEEEIRSLLEPVFGPRNVAVALNLQLDFDKETTETVKYEPVVDGEGIAQDLSELSESVQNGTGGESGGVPGISGNDGSSYAYTDTATAGSYEQSSKTVHYLVNEIRQQMEKAQGQIKDLSVSVVINQKEQNPQVQQQVQDIVCKAIGVDESKVAVQFMPFAAQDPSEEPSREAYTEQAGLSRPTILIMIAFALVVAVFVLLLMGMSARQRRIMAEAEQLRAALSQPEGPQTVLQEVMASDDEESPASKESEASILRKLEQMFNERPDMTARLLRTWMTD